MEAFSARLRSELPELNFLLGFKALASTNSWVEAWFLNKTTLLRTSIFYQFFELAAPGQ
jgi:hypothetical protein